MASRRISAGLREKGMILSNMKIYRFYLGIHSNPALAGLYG